LRMLRSQLGDDLFRRCILTYLQRHKFDNVVTEDLNAVVEELSGRSFDRFFDQWVYHAAQPDLAVEYSWDEKTKLAKLSIQQNQKLSDDVLLFDVPLTIRFQGKSSSVDRTITVKEKAEDFYFPLPQAPEIVRIDPEMVLLAKIAFHPPTPMLYAQLVDKNDALGRVIAAEQLGGKKERGAVAKLKEALNTDPFYAVRQAASQALRSIQTDEALTALLASTKQSDARVRRQVIGDVSTYYRESTYAAAQTTLQEEKNPDIQAAALRALAPYSKPEVRTTLLQYLDSDSYRSVLADAAIAAMRAQDKASYIEPLQTTLQKTEAVFTTDTFSRGLKTLD